MHEFFEKSFDLEATYKNILSIQVALDGFCFSILSCDEKRQLLAFKSFPLKISSNKLIARHFESWLKKEKLLQKQFKKIRVVIFSKEFTLVPNAFYSNNLKLQITHTLFAEGSQLEFAENLLEKFDCKLLFALPKGLNEVIQKQIGECEITHPVKTILNNVSAQNNKNQLTLLLNNKNCYLILKENEQIKIANNYPTNHVNDLVYYTLSVLQQFNVSAKNTLLRYGGNSIYKEEAETQLKKYFPHIEQLKSPNFQISENLVNKSIPLFL